MYETVIGLEIHAQISTKTKMFCRCSNDSFGAQPNTNVCPICMGFPGMLPAINEEAVEKGLRAALSLGCTIPSFSKFDRKNYFYPDLPKGFQISQYDKPISEKGSVQITLHGKKKSVGITRLHLEDDAGKLMHEARGTLCDYNRSGCPLMEIVSEPDMCSEEEASAYAQEIRKILRTIGASECDMEKGMMRFDINVSLRKKDAPLGTKVEVKNLNSFKALERALVFEIKRQSEALDRGEKILQETRGWDDQKGETVSQRSKEEAHDYRYFPEPDLPPLLTKAQKIEHMRAALPELPLMRRERFLSQYKLTEEAASQLADEREMAEFFEKAVKIAEDALKVAAFINTILLKHLNADQKALSACKISPEDLGMLIKFVNDGIVSNNMAKAEIFEEMYKTGKSPAAIIKDRGLAVVSDSSQLESACKKILGANPQAAADFRSGKQNAFGFLVGQVMKEMKGKANPQMVNEILKKMLGSIK